MEWTREQRYLPYNKWDAETLLKLQAQADNSSYQLNYHIRPSSGLLNDPNGFSYYNNRWHVFYQSYPFGAVHGLKSWVHLESCDLVHWQNKGLALGADTKYDSHGAYSGSATAIDDKLSLMYTGNVRDQNWQRISYQNGATMDKNGIVTKLAAPLIYAPAHVTEHFRDPQLLKHRDAYYVLLGAQDKTTLSGKVAVFKSKDLKNWEDLGYLDFSPETMGYMIECPNLVFIDDKPVLIFCPQGLDKNVANYDNIYPNMYVVGDKLKFDAARMETKQVAPINLDDGFDVYATQAFNAPDGKAYAISWVGLPDMTYPTDEEGWANCFSQVKELSLDEQNRLVQRPVPAMADLRQAGQVIKAEKAINGRQILVDNASRSYELKLTIPKGQAGTLHLVANQDLSESLQLKFATGDAAQLVVDRAHSGIQFASDYGFTRQIDLSANEDLELDIFVDNSLFEIFVNGGLKVLTGRFFGSQANNQIAIQGTTKEELAFRGTYWRIDHI